MHIKWIDAAESIDNVIMYISMLPLNQQYIICNSIEHIL